MEKLIDIESFILQAKKRGIDFGKGDPYNRIRYYTKIGLLPHMVRKKGSKSTIKGHYPEIVLDQLEQIEKLKNEGLDNTDILAKLEIKTEGKHFASWLKSPDTRNKMLKHGTFLMVAIIMFVELGVLQIGTYKKDLVPSQAYTKPGVQEILGSGTAFMPAGRNTVFIKSNNISTNSKVYLSFNDDYSPAIRYWTSDRVPNAGFYISLDAPTYKDAEFNWWITN